MKKRNIFLTFLFGVTISISSFAQGGGIWNFNWDIGFPIGETSDFIAKPSLRGFAIEGRGYLNDRFLVGGRFAWNTFYENEGWVTEDITETVTINGYSRNYMNVIPIMVTGHFEFGYGAVLPYIGIGLGTYYIESRDYLGIYYAQDKAWHFGVYPEIGAVIPFGSGNTAFNINAKYNYAAKTKDVSAQSWISLGVGLSYIF
jgi:hypothetical protein